MQRKFLFELLKVCREHEIYTVVDTSGYATWEALDSIRSKVNLFLYDLKLMDDERHRHYTGVSNNLILSNLGMLAERGHDVLVRIPLIPGVNDDLENLRQSGEFLAGLGNKPGVELMGYHDIAQSKYQALGMVYHLPETKSPSRESLQAAADVLAGYGLNVRLS